MRDDESPSHGEKGVKFYMALFDKVGRISDVPDGEPFIVLDFKTQQMDTTYGPRECIYLRIKRADDDEPEWIQGFSAGLLSQLRNSERKDFPAWVKLTTTEGGRGRSGTRIFEPAEDNGEQLVLTDDDIPF
jgi:hypothetical protein